MNLKPLLFARIKQMEFINFRNIEKGKVELPNSDFSSFLDEEPSILGLYGQNGSGKTSVIMALGILKKVLSGEKLGYNYSSCIKKGSDRCTLRFVFAIYGQAYESGKPVWSSNLTSCFEAYYNFDIVDIEDINSTESSDSSIETEEPLRKLCIENEVFKIKRTTVDESSELSKQVFFDTRKEVSDLKGRAFGSKSKHDLFTGGDKSVALKLRELKTIAHEDSRSFLFSKSFLSVIDESFTNNPKMIAYSMLSSAIGHAFADKQYSDELDYSGYGSAKAKQKEEILQDFVDKHDKELQAKFDHYLDSEEFVKLFKELHINPDFHIDSLNLKEMPQVVQNFFIPATILYSLNTFGKNYLHVIDTVTTGQTNINETMPFFIWQHVPSGGLLNTLLPINMNKPTEVLEDAYPMVEKSINSVSEVIGKIVPGLSIAIRDKKNSVSSKTNRKLCSFTLVAVRDGIEIPLRYESDGVRRIISILNLLIAAYNDRSFTVAIDELDSGIFEYLLGEILLIMRDGLKGQLIFTSHNLRPLEVLPAKYLCFTTTDSSDRFTKLSQRGNSNLRDTYFRNIILGSDKISVYNPTDKYDIEFALQKVGYFEVGK